MKKYTKMYDENGVELIDMRAFIQAVQDSNKENREKLLEAVKNADVISDDMVEKVIDILTNLDD